MPYTIKKQPDGKFKVCKKDEPKKCFSKKGIPLLNAKKQISAISISEHRPKTITLRGGAKVVHKFLMHHKKQKSKDGYALHALVYHKPIPLKKAMQHTHNILKSNKKTPYRETKSSYRFDNINKKHFNPKSFRTEVINPQISLIWGHLKGGGAEPEEFILNDLAKEAYKQKSNEMDGFKILEQTPTIQIWKKDNENTIVISVRGSYDVRDWKTNLSSLAFNNLEKSDRYKEDKNFVGQAIQKYGSGNDIYITSHSLGGVIANQLQKDFPQIKSGIAFNPAYQTKDFFFPTQSSVRKKYNKNDLLGVLGRYLPNAEVEKQDETFLEKIKPVSIFDRLKGHALNAFSSGKHRGGSRVIGGAGGTYHGQLTTQNFNNNNQSMTQPMQHKYIKQPLQLKKDSNGVITINIYNK